VLDQAREDGLLSFLNRAYRDARRAGLPVARYGIVQTRLRRVILMRLANGGDIQPRD
jgi:hypothetical protein